MDGNHTLKQVSAEGSQDGVGMEGIRYRELRDLVVHHSTVYDKDVVHDVQDELVLDNHRDDTHKVHKDGQDVVGGV